MKTLPVLALLLVTVFPAMDRARAAVVTLAFTGTYDTGGRSVFGMSGDAVPYRYEITYDTGLAPAPVVIPAGTITGESRTVMNMLGYSREGITGASLTFGTQSWTPGQIVARVPVAGVTGDLWFDTDLSAATPTLTWMFFQAPHETGGPFGNVLEVGGGWQFPEGVSLQPFSSLFPDDAGPNRSDGVSRDLTITAIPEPSAAALLGLGAWACAGRRRRGRVE